MKFNTVHWLLAATLLAVAAPQAHAQAGTTAGTQIGNTATVSYKIGTIEQEEESGTAEFMVDRLLSVTVAEVGNSSRSVTPGDQQQALLFTVTNGTNDQMDIGLGATNRADDDEIDYDGAGVGDDPLVDNFDAAGFTYYVDVDEDGVFEPGGDDGSAVTFLDEILPDAVVDVWVVSDNTANSIPLGLDDGDVAIIRLTATLLNSTASDDLYLVDVDGDPDPLELYEAPDGLEGTTADDDTGVDVAGSVQNVFTNGVDGTDFYDDAYEVSAAAITVTKRSLVFWDPINESTNPKAIPGAAVLYCITVKNEGGTAASDVTISDQIPANTAFVEADATLGITDATDSIRFSTDDTCVAADWTAGTHEDVVDDQSGVYDDDTPDNPLITGPTVTTTKDELDANTGVTTTMFMVKVE